MTRTVRLAAAGIIGACLAAPHAAQAQVPSWPSESPPRPLPARSVAFPPYEVRTLPNGLQVVVVMHHEQPVVSVRLVVRAGCAQDPDGRPGLANLVASLLDQGTTARSAQEIAQSIDSIGGELETAAGTDLTSAGVTVMKDSFDVGLDLLSDVVRQPAFAPEELERQRQQIRSSLRVSQEDPTYLATVVFERLVYGFHPYAFPGTGTLDSIERITRDDIIDFHRRYYAPNNSLLAIVGDVTAGEAFERARQVFGSWARSEVPVVPVAEPPAPTRRVVIIDKPDAVQTVIRVGHLGIPRKTRDFVAADLAVKILGGEGSNRLQRVLRTERGLTYGASADLDAYRQSGDIVAETDTRSEATGEVLRLMVDEFFRLQRDNVREEELADAKAYMAGSFPLGIETPDQIASRVLNVLFYGLPLEELQTFRERVNAVTVDDIQRVTRAYLRPDRLSIVLVGNAAAFSAQLARVGFRDFEIVAQQDLDLSAADLRRPRDPRLGPLSHPGQPALRRPPMAREPAMSRQDWDAAKAVVMRAVAARGGLETLQAVRTLVATAATVLTTPQGPLRATTTTYIEYPGRFRVDAAVPSGEIIQAYVDGTAWLKDPTGVRDAPDGMRDEFRQSVHRDVLTVLLAAAGDKLMGRRLPDERGTGGRALDVVELWSDGMGAVRLYVDQATGQVARESYQVQGPLGSETTVEEFDDYRAVDGLWVPFKAVVRRESAPLLERTITRLQVNAALPPGIFTKPQ